MTDLDRIIRTLRENRGVLAPFTIRSLRVFGSTARGDAGPASDVDILVEFEDGAPVGLIAFARLKNCLEQILQRRVDLATPEALRKALRTRILDEAVDAF